MPKNQTDVIQTLINSTWTVQELARRQKVTVLTVHNWRAQGLPSIVVKGDQRPSIRFHRGETLAWIKARKKAG